MRALSGIGARTRLTQNEANVPTISGALFSFSSLLTLIWGLRERKDESLRQHRFADQLLERSSNFGPSYSSCQRNQTLWSSDRMFHGSIQRRNRKMPQVS